MWPATRSLAIPSRRTLRRKRIAFVFSGGGNLGAVQVGMAKALIDEGIDPDVIVGCSVGAINGAALATEPGAIGIRRLERIWSRLADGKPDLMPRSILPLAIQMARKGQSLHDRGALEQLLRSELLSDTFEELAIPFACVATDLASAEAHWFETGNLLSALLASAALPAVYPPFEIDGRSYIDGGVVSEAPVAKAVDLGATDVYFLHVGHLDGRSFNPVRPFDGAIHSYWTLRYRRLEDELTAVQEHCNLIRVPGGVRPRLRFDDFSKGRELIAAGYDAALHFLRTGEVIEPTEIHSRPPRDKSGKRGAAEEFSEPDDVDFDDEIESVE